MQPFSHTHYSARILERRDLADNLWVIRIDPRGSFAYVPGQYATLGVVSLAAHYERPYSIVSSPDEQFLEFFLELVPQGEVTPRLYACKVGDEITLRKTAKGAFTLDLSGARINHLLLATVTGISPFVSHIRSFRRQWKSAEIPGGHRLLLLEGASRSWELGYQEEMIRTAGEVSWLTYVPTVSRQREDLTWKGETGRVDDLVRKYADIWGLTPDNTIVYLCGHPGMIESCRGIVGRRGWNKDAIKSEAFFVPGSEALEPEHERKSTQRP